MQAVVEKLFDCILFAERCVISRLLCRVLLGFIDKACYLVKHFGNKVNNSFRGVVICSDVLESNFAVADNEESNRSDGYAGSAAAAEKLLIVL